MLTVLAPAKINLGLHVLERRADGFHDLETVFVRIPWCDRVSVEPARGRSMTCSDPDLPVDEQNLCLKAARLLADRLGISSGVRLHLEKWVPYGAGLGSGSSDAAAALRLLVRLWDVDPTPELMADVAAELGSDVPFFLGPPVALGTGRGERLTPLDGLPSLPMVVAVPPVHVATGAAYGMVRPSRVDRPDLAAVVTQFDVTAWPGTVVNDFEEPVAAAHPEISQTLARMKACGARYAALSGSGSAVFGLFEDLDSAARASFEGLGCRVWHGWAGDPDEPEIGTD